MPRSPRKSTKPAAAVRPLIRPTVPRGCLYPSVLDLVGGTPLVGLPRLKQADGLHADLALKVDVADDQTVDGVVDEGMHQAGNAVGCFNACVQSFGGRKTRERKDSAADERG